MYLIAFNSLWGYHGSTNCFMKLGKTMKKIVYSLFILLFVLVVVACSGDASTENVAEEDDYLEVISNLETNGTPIARSIGSLAEAPPITGVLLKFHNEGLYDPNNSFFAGKFNNKNAFYLEYLYEDKETWYGMKFNYVLYVPDKIQKAYQNGNGRNPDSGNPFWWYMSTYYGQSSTIIKDDWATVLEFLLNNRNHLENPKAKDVTGSWNKSWESGTKVSNGTNSLNNNIGIYYYEEDNRDYGIDPDSILYFEAGKYSQKASKGNEKKQIFIPSELSAIYFSGSGEESLVQADVVLSERLSF